mgnify:FL=1
MVVERDAAYAGPFEMTHYPGIAVHVLGWEMVPDEDTEWTGMFVRSGKLLAVMVGDDYRHKVEPEDLVPIDEDAYCACCGQMSCEWNSGSGPMR